MIEENKRQAFCDKIFEAILGAQQVQTAYLGYKLGWYQALAAANDTVNDSDVEKSAEVGMTASDLALATKSSSRYAREWLEQQTVTGWVDCLNPTESDPEARRFCLPAAHAGVLTDDMALDYILPVAVIQAGWGKDIDKLVEAYRNDTGLSWEDMTPDAREQQAAQNRPFFVKQLPQVLEESLERATVERLQSGRGKIADIGAGYCWSSIGMGKYFSNCQVDAYDLDQPSIDAAKINIFKEGLQGRVRAFCADAATVLDKEDHEPYDLVMALECIHDMNDPISVLNTMRLLSGDKGEVIVMDERVAEEFCQAVASKDPVEQAMYGFSCMCCLADGKSRPNSVATGTVMRPKILRMYAQQAGFREIEILPAENDFFRFYKLLK